MRKPIKLYRYSISGHAHRVELFLSLLGIPVEIVEVDLGKGEGRRPEFLAKSPFGQVPVIEDGDVTLYDSNAILVYLAARYDSSHRWMPSDPITAAHVQRWFSISAGPLHTGPGALRRAALLGEQIDRAHAERVTPPLLALLQAELSKSPFLVGETPTLADIALYSYTKHAPEGGVSLDGYPAVREWLARVEALAGFVPLRHSVAKAS